MRTTWKRGMSFVVSASMVFGLVPAPALAQMTNPLAADDAPAVELVPEQEEVSPEEVTPPLETVQDSGKEVSKEQKDLEPADDELADDELAVATQAEGDVTQMTLDTPYNVEVQSEEYWVGSFTATMEGTYIFYSEGSDDTYGHLYSDADLTNELANDDDGNGNGQFRISYNLAEGQTVYLKARQYSDGAMSCTVFVKRINDKDLAFGRVVTYTYYSFVSNGTLALNGAVLDANENTLEEGTDFEYVYLGYDDDGELVELAAPPTEPGNYYVYACAIGMTYTGRTAEQEFGIADYHDLSNGTIELVKDSYIVGGTVPIQATVHDAAGNLLTEGTDYELVFVDGFNYAEVELADLLTEQGYYGVYAVGINDYNGYQTSTYYFSIINQYDLDGGYIDLDRYTYEATGGPVVLEGKVYDNDCHALVEGSDFEFVFLGYDDEGETYELDGAPSQAGDYLVYARGIDGVSVGQTDTAGFSIEDKSDLSRTGIELNKHNYVVTGAPVVLQHTLYDVLGNKLTEGTDYELVFFTWDDDERQELESAPSDPGYYYVYARAIGSTYTGSTDYVSFNIYDPYDIGGNGYNHYFDGSDELEHTGEPVELPAMVIARYDDETGDDVYLAEGTDFILAWVEDADGHKLSTMPSDPGDYYAVYEGMGTYHGTYKQSFAIRGNGYDLSLARITLYDAECDYTGDPVELWPDVCDANGSWLSEGYAYELVYYDASDTELAGAPSDAGDYQVAARAKQGTDYFGESAKVVFHICGTDDIGHSDFWAGTVGSTRVVYTGKPLAPPTVNIYSDNDDTSLVGGVDYELSHIEDQSGTNLGATVTEVGHYYAVYVGIGSYTGHRRVGFEVVDPHDLSGASIKLASYDVPLEDGVTAPQVTVTDAAGNVLTPGTDYVLQLVFEGDEGDEEVSSITRVGTYYVYAKPGSNGVYTGSSSYYSFAVFDPHALNNGYWNYRFEPSDSITVKDKQLPTPVIYRGEGSGKITLEEGRDFELDHIESVEYYDSDEDESEPTNYGKVVPTTPGSYRAIYKGILPYTGTLSIYFSVYDPFDIGGNDEYGSYWSGYFNPNGEVLRGATELPKPVIYRVDDQDSVADIILAQGIDYELDHIEDDDGNDLGTQVPTVVGDYRAVYVGKGDYHGSKGIWFSVYAADNIGSSYWNSSYVGGRTLYTDGEAIELPTLLLYNYDDNVSLTQGTDFEFVRFEDEDGNAIDAPTADGEYWAVYEGKGDYQGSRREWFDIDTSYNLANARLKLAKTSFEATNEPVAIEAKVRDSVGIKLDPSKDYELVYRNEQNEDLAQAPSQRGTYYVAARAKDGSTYFGRTNWVVITIGEQSVQPLPDPDAVPMTLNDPIDVTLARNESWVGVFTAQETGAYVFGSEGTSDTFGVLYADAQKDDELAYDDDSGDGRNFSIARKLDAGQTVYLLARGYDYRAVRCNVSVQRIDAYDLRYATINETSNAQVQNGLLVPQLAVTDVLGEALVEGTHYELEYYHEGDEDDEEVDQITEVGEYYAIAKAIDAGGYTGRSARCYFYVYDANDLSGARIVQDKSYYALGDDVTAGIAVYDRTGKLLQSGSDYRLVFYRNVDDRYVRCDSAPSEVGDFIVTAVGVGDTYTGRTGTYSLHIHNPYDLATSGSVYLYDYDYSQSVGYDSIPVYLMDGSAVQPRMGVYCGQDLSEDEYTVSYENNTAATTDDNWATVTVTGVAPYEGTITRKFKLVQKLDLSAMVSYGGVAVTAGDETQYRYDGSEALQFLAANWPCDTLVRFTRDTVHTPVQGKDFTVSFTDADGNPLDQAPSTVGKYKMVLTATDGGVFCGTAKIRFSLVGTRDVTDSPYPSLHDSRFHETSWDTDEDGTNSIGVAEILDNVGSMFFDLYAGGATLIQNLDYTVRAVADGIYELVGIGSYEDSLLVRVFGAANVQESFESYYATVGRRWYEGSYVNSVGLLANGTLEQPDVLVDGLTEGVDYTFASYEDESGKSITTANLNDTVYVRLVGAGDYAGCTRDIKATVFAGTNDDDISSNIASLQITNGQVVNTQDGSQWYLLRSAAPKVMLVVYRRHRLVVNQGQGLVVTTTVSADKKTAQVVATAAEGLPVVGTRSLAVNLVDSYDLNTFARQPWVSDAFETRGAYFTGDPIELSYAGVSYMPTVSFPQNGSYTSAPEVKLTLKNAAGTKVDAINGAGNYTLVVEGTGSWSGGYTIPLVVSEMATITDLGSFGMSIGTNTQLVNGKAEPTVTLRYGGIVLTQGKDYTVEYGNNTTDGERAWIKVKAVQGSGFVGAKKANFVVGTSKVLCQGDYALFLADPAGDGFVDAASCRRSYAIFGGKGPAVKVFRKSATGVRDELDPANYDVSFGDLSQPGLTYVKVTGKNGFSGSLSANFYAAASESISINEATVELGATSYTYDGKVKNPGVKSVTLGGVTLVEGRDYKVGVPSGRVNVGTYTYTVTGMGAYEGAAKASFKINVAASTITLANQTKTYTGKALAYSGTVTKKGSSGKVTYEYFLDAKGTKSVVAANVKNAKTYYVRATLAADNNHEAATSALAKFKIAKAANPMVVKVAKKAASAKKLKTKAVAVAPFKVSKAEGTVSYTRVKKGSDAALSVNKTTGKVTVKKKTKKGTYTIKVKIKAKGNTNYAAVTKTVTAKVVVK